MADTSQGRALPAIYTNYYSVTISQENVRIAFGEAFGSAETAIYHSAVSLSPQNAQTLAELILRLVNEQKSRAAPDVTGTAKDA